MWGLVGDTQVGGRDPAGSQREAEPTWVGVIAAGAPTAVGWERSRGDGCVGAQVRIAMCSETLPCAHSASGSQRVCLAPARPCGSHPPPQRPLTSRDLGESPSVSSLPPGVLERRRRGSRGPSALASLSLPCWRVKYQTPSGPQTPVASMTCSSSLPGLPSLTFLLQFPH